MNMQLSALKWLARISSIISVSLMLIFISSDNNAISSATKNDFILMVFFPIGVIIGMIISWFKEGIGGLFSFSCLGIFYALNFYLSNKFPEGPYFLFLTIPAFIFLLYWYVSFTVSFRKMKT